MADNRQNTGVSQDSAAPVKQAAEISPKRTPSGQRVPIRYFMLLVLACFMFASQGIAIKFLARQLKPIQITFLPFCAATLLMTPLLVVSRRLRPGGGFLTWTDWRAFIIAGIGGQIVAQLGFVWGVTLSLVSNAAILCLLLPTISAVLAAAMLRERLTALHIVALVFGFGGALLLSAERLSDTSFIDRHFLAGNLLIIAGVTGSAFYNTYCKGLFARFEQIDVLVLSYITAAVASLPLLIWVEPVSIKVLQHLTLPSLVAFAYQALVTYGVAMLLFFTALKHLAASTAALSMYLIPLFSVALAAGVLGERLSLLAVCGSAVIVTSTAVFLRFAKSE